MIKLISTNPAKNYEYIGEVDISTKQDVDNVIDTAHGAKKVWKNTHVAKRVKLLQSICNELGQRETEIANLICAENGKVYSEALYEAQGGVEEFQWFLDNVEKSLSDEITQEDETSLHRVRYEPFGVAGVIVPWNFPFANIIRGIIPNLLAGNCVILKVSEETPLMGKLLEEVISNSELPDGVFNEVYGDGAVGSYISHGNINYIWFTGSTAVGQELYKIAAEKMIPVTLELGGSNPCIVCQDVDIKKAAKQVYGGRFFNAGEVCDSIKRLLIHESIIEEFTFELQKIVESKKIGDPLNDNTDIGSLIAERQCTLLQEQINDAVSKGAKILCGGTKSQDFKGAFFEPTLLTNITTDMRVWNEEVFGPVLPIISFGNDEEAIRLANDTIYGLGSRVICNNSERANIIASQIDAGTVEINYGSRWLTCNPFGGYKMSGIGREHGIMGFRELCQVKCISESK